MGFQPLPVQLRTLPCYQLLPHALQTHTDSDRAQNAHFITLEDAIESENYDDGDELFV